MWSKGMELMGNMPPEATVQIWPPHSHAADGFCMPSGCCVLPNAHRLRRPKSVGLHALQLPPELLCAVPVRLFPCSNRWLVYAAAFVAFSSILNHLPTVRPRGHQHFGAFSLTSGLTFAFAVCVLCVCGHAFVCGVHVCVVPSSPAIPRAPRPETTKFKCRCTESLTTFVLRGCKSLQWPLYALFRLAAAAN